ncbi:sigma-70 family RNA polymerase sigma factor [Pseudomonas sp. S36]|uniref:sigma-70 family RNA polymerase sigma factor n=1 Tax=Pseudomonas sp. S36 TaxID=2767447 RepID=UPI001911E07B|nr:sigma-70 family RNA polymerase sigma factor [Pseudomonas sp. S36]MBK4989194.1 sigma-70 family RNA polymerase sigma factor [Pseudomonas sp. S36]
MPGASSLEDIYVSHHGWLQSWLRQRLKNAEDAADLAQDTFVRVMQRRQMYTVHEPRPYLRTIARGLVIDLWRHRDIERAWLETLAHLPEDQVPPPEVGLLAIEALVAIDRLLDDLPGRVRTAFLLAKLDGMKCPLIAERLGVSLATVERDIAKALRHCYRVQFEADQ